MTDPLTKDLSDFGYRELRMATDLLNAYLAARPDFLSDGVAVWLNRNSGYVFLSDENYNVAMLNGDKLEQFHSCPECGAEGFADEMPDNNCCQDYLRQAA